MNQGYPEPEHMSPPLRSFLKVADEEKVMEDGTLQIGMQVTLLRSTSLQCRSQISSDKRGDANRELAVGARPVCAAVVPPLLGEKAGSRSRGSPGAPGSVSPTRALQKTHHEKEGRSR
jgi:hypothetical protein